MCDRKVGNIGQGDFIKLCADAGLACGTSQGDDYAGWDFLVDFPLKKTIKSLANGDDRAIECKVQVKSSDNKNKSIQVKLSNLKRFCDSTIPCFFFIVEYNGKMCPDNMYLVHTDEGLILKILKRLRENEARDKSPLNRITMNIPYEKKDRIYEYSGRALKEKIESYVKEGMSNYVKRKESQLKTLGYNKSNYEMKFEINSNEDYISLTRSFLGYHEKINIKNIESWSKRFDIKILEDELTQEKAIIELSNIRPTTTGEIVFESNSDTLSFPCEYYLSPLSTNTLNTPILRAKCDNIDILFYNNNSDTKVTFIPSDKVIGIFEMRDTLLLMKFLLVEDNPISIQLKRVDGSPMTFKIGGTSKSNDSQKEDLELSILSIENLIGIATQSRLESKLKLSINSLRNNTGNIIGLYNLLNKGSSAKKQIINIEPEDKNIIIETGETMCVILSISLSFELMSFSIIISVQGIIQTNNKNYILDNYLLKIEKILSDKDKNIIIEERNRTADSLCKKYISENTYTFNSISGEIKSKLKFYRGI